MTMPQYEGSGGASFLEGLMGGAQAGARFRGDREDRKMMLADRERMMARQAWLDQRIRDQDARQAQQQELDDAERVAETGQAMRPASGGSLRAPDVQFGRSFQPPVNPVRQAVGERLSGRVTADMGLNPSPTARELPSSELGVPMDEGFQSRQVMQVAPSRAESELRTVDAASRNADAMRGAFPDRIPAGLDPNTTVAVGTRLLERAEPNDWSVEMHPGMPAVRVNRRTGEVVPIVGPDGQPIRQPFAPRATSGDGAGAVTPQQRLRAATLNQQITDARSRANSLRAPNPDSYASQADYRAAETAYQTRKQQLEDRADSLTAVRDQEAAGLAPGSSAAGALTRGPQGGSVARGSTTTTSRASALTAEQAQALVDEVARQHPDWTDDQVRAEARRRSTSTVERY